MGVSASLPPCSQLLAVLLVLLLVLLLILLLVALLVLLLVLVLLILVLVTVLILVLAHKSSLLLILFGYRGISMAFLRQFMHLRFIFWLAQQRG